MNSLEIFCPYCGTCHELEFRYYGRKVQCSKCGMKFWSGDGRRENSYDKGQSSGINSKLQSGKGGLFNDWIDNALLKLRKLNWERWIADGEKFCIRYGSYSFWLVGVLALFGFLINGIRFHNGSFVSWGVAIAVMSILFSWIDYKMINACQRVSIAYNRNCCSQEIIDCFFMLFFVVDVILAVLLVFALCVNSIGPYQLFALLMYIFIFSCLVICALKPQIINIETRKESSPAQELIGILMFPSKTLAKITPFIWFGTTLVIAGVLLVYLFSPYAVSSMCQISMLGLPFHKVAFVIILSVGLFPLIVYFYVLVNYFLLDIISAILCVPKILKVVENKHG